MSYSEIESEIRALVRNDDFELTDHAEDKIANNFFTFEDVENSILNGFVYKVEMDDHGQSKDGKKYVIQGSDGHGHELITCGKIMVDDEGKYYLVISVY